MTVPEPGRVLAEANDRGSRRTYILTPVDGGAHTYIEVMTALEAGTGVRGAIVWLFMLLMTPIIAFAAHMTFDSFRDKLERIAQTWNAPIGEAQG